MRLWGPLRVILGKSDQNAIALGRLPIRLPKHWLASTIPYCLPVEDDLCIDSLVLQTSLGSCCLRAHGTTAHDAGATHFHMLQAIKFASSNSSLVYLDKTELLRRMGPNCRRQCRMLGFCICRHTFPAHGLQLAYLVVCGLILLCFWHLDIPWLFQASKELKRLEQLHCEGFAIMN